MQSAIFSRQCQLLVDTVLMSGPLGQSSSDWLIINGLGET